MDLDLSPVLFAQSADYFAAVVRGVPSDRWDGPGLGVWTARELAAHATRAMTTVSLYLEDPGADGDAPEIEVDDAVEYYRTLLPVAGVHERVAQRGREAVHVLGDDPAAAVAALVATTRALVEGASAAAVCRTPAGVMTLADYLDTRIVELVTHGLDLAAATGQEVAPPPAAARRALDVLAAAVPVDEVPTVVRALAGRAPLPAGYNVLG